MGQYRILRIWLKEGTWSFEEKIFSSLPCESAAITFSSIVMGKNTLRINESFHFTVNVQIKDIKLIKNTKTYLFTSTIAS